MITFSILHHVDHTNTPLFCDVVLAIRVIFNVTWSTDKIVFACDGPTGVDGCCTWLFGDENPYSNGSTFSGSRDANWLEAKIEYITSVGLNFE